MICLGNMTVKEMEKRCGIELIDEERDALEALRESTCDKVEGNTKIHIYDIPFMIVCGDGKARSTVIDVLAKYASKMKTPLQVGGGI